MLVLTRFFNDVVEIEHGGETLTVMVTEVKNARVKLGFAGPASFKVLRQEVADRGRKIERLAKDADTV